MKQLGFETGQILACECDLPLKAFSTYRTVTVSIATDCATKT
jgi:hypothetical protein